MTMRLTLTMALLVASTTAFVPLVVPSSNSGSFFPSRQQQRHVLRSTESSPNDPFDSYAMNDDSQVLAIKDEIIGEGDGVKADNILSVDYTGRLMANGKIFDSGKFEFKLGEGRVMPGWEQGLIGLQVGGKRILRIPPSLGYGAKGAGSTIPPNSDLEFEIELNRIDSGPLAELILRSGLGLNNKTYGLLALAAFSIILPQLGIIEKGFI